DQISGRSASRTSAIPITMPAIWSTRGWSAAVRGLDRLRKPPGCEQMPLRPARRALVLRRRDSSYARSAGPIFVVGLASSRSLSAELTQHASAAGHHEQQIAQNADDQADGDQAQQVHCAPLEHPRELVAQQCRERGLVCLQHLLDIAAL